MELREMIAQLWELGGEVSDLDPWGANTVDYDPDIELDADSYGVKWYIRQINNAQRVLANWRTRLRRPVRFKKFLVNKNVRLGGTLNVTDVSFTTSVDTFDIRLTVRITDSSSEVAPQLDDIVGANIILTPTWTDGVDSLSEEVDTKILAANSYSEVAGIGYTDYIYDVEIKDLITYENLADSTFLRESSAGTAVMYTNEFNVYSNGTATQSKFNIVFPTTFRNILRITVYDGGAKVVRAESKEQVFDVTTAGDPTLWYTTGDKVYFNSLLEDETWITFYYQRMPAKITSLDDTIDIPESHHEILMLIVEWNQAKRSQERDKASIIRSEVDRVIDQTRNETEEEWLGDVTGGFKIQREA